MLGNAVAPDLASAGGTARCSLAPLWPSAPYWKTQSEREAASVANGDLGAVLLAALMARFFSPLVWAKPLLLCLWLKGCWAVWRYETSVGHYILFTARTGIHLVYEGASFVEWEYSVLCTMDDKSSRTPELNCPVAGTHMVKPKLRGSLTFQDRERYLTINADLDCFLWYVYTSFTRSSLHSAHVTLVVWIYDPENADSKEMSHTAKGPPEHSKTLSRQFLNLGQSPSIKMLHVGEDSRESEESEYSADGYWEIDVPSISNYIIGVVIGKPVTFQGCFVARTPFTMAKSEIPPVNVHDVSISTPAGSELMITWSACHTTKAVVVTNYGAFLTHDEFRHTKKITFPSTVLDPAVAQKVNDVAIVQVHIVFLIDSSAYFINNDKMFRVGKQHKLPERGILGIKERIWCLRNYPVQVLESDLSEAILWTKTEIFLMYPSRNITDMFALVMEVDVLKSLTGFKDHVTLAVISACYDSIPSEISVLLACTGCKTSTQLYVAGFNEDEGHWFLRDLSLPAPTSDPLHMEVVFGASSSMLLWYSDKIIYSYKGSKFTGYIKDTETGAELSATALGTVIHQVVIGSAGNTVIKMKNNDMFFLKFNMKDVLKLSAWETEAKDFAIYVNGHGDFYLLINNGTHIYYKAYPLKTEVLSATNPLGEVCPYISFQHNMEADTYYLDMGTNMTFWAQIVFLENVGLSTEVTIYRSHLLKQNNSIQYEIARGICTKNQTVTLYHDHDYSTEGEYEDGIISSTGIMTIEVEPSLTGRTCMTPNKVAHINVGCPVFRDLVIEKPTNCSNQTFTFKIPAKYRWVKTQGEDWVQEYNLALFGCPIEVHYARPFRPTVLLYEREKMIGTVEANYILWEMNARNDYHYNTTVKQSFTQLLTVLK
ncbi:cation channel sperm-associated auxiliary subunit epsilon isoform X4 [Podarcis muralis]